MKLHSNSVIYRSLERLWALAIFFLVGAFIDGANFWVSLLFSIIPLSIAFGFMLLWQYFYWKNFNYKWNEDVLRIDSGVISTQSREVPLKRVQNIDVHENIVQQALGIAEVRFETAGGGNTEAILKCVSLDEADRLRREFKKFKEGEDALQEEGEESRGNLLYEINSRELGILCLTSYSLRGTLTIFTGFVFLVAGFYFQTDFEVERNMMLFLAPFIFVGSFFIAWIINAVRSFFAFYNFKLYKSGDSLNYSRGLLRKFSGSIPLDKLQSLTLEEGVIERFLGYAGLKIETAGYSTSQKEERGAEAAIPLTRTDNIYEILEEIQQVEIESLHSIPKRALRRYTLRYIIAFSIIVSIIYAAIAPPTAIIAGLIPVLIGLAVTGAYLKWIHKGYYTLEDFFVARNGFWKRKLRIVPYYRIQNVIVSQTIFQRKWDLASVTADTAGSFVSLSGNVIATDLDAEKAVNISEHLFESLQDALTERRRMRMQK